MLKLKNKNKPKQKGLPECLFTVSITSISEQEI